MVAITARLKMIAMDQEQQLVSNWVDRLRMAGLNEPEILSATENPNSFGHAEAHSRIKLAHARPRALAYSEIQYGSRNTA